MTRLEAIEARAEAGFRPCGPDDGLVRWCDYADDDRSWLLARVKELAKVLQALDKEALGDFLYYIKDRELQGWHGPRITNWSKACEDLKTALAALDEENP